MRMKNQFGMNSFILAIIIFLALSHGANAYVDFISPYPEEKVIAGDGAIQDQFGSSVAVYGNWAVIGAPNADEEKVVIIIEPNPNGQLHDARISTEDAPPGWRSGKYGELKPAEKPLSHDAIISTDPISPDWKLGGKELIAEIKPEDSGSKIAVDCGAAYVFHHDGTGWSLVKKLMASDRDSGDHFGSSVDIFNNTIVVGAPGNGDGVVYVFERHAFGYAESWGQVERVFPPGPKDLSFGSSVSVYNNTLAIGASGEYPHGAIPGAAYVFERNEGGADNWGAVVGMTAASPSPKDYYGCSVSIDRNTLVVGASGDTLSGTAYVYERNEGGADSWGEVQRIIPGNSGPGSLFGQSVDISRNALVVGAPLHGLDAGKPYGAAYVYHRNIGGAENWGEAAMMEGEIYSRFGSSVGISTNWVVIGAYTDQRPAQSPHGLAYLFNREDGACSDDWVDRLPWMEASDAGQNDYFGWAVAIDRGRILIGAPGNDGPYNSGSAYFYE